MYLEKIVQWSKTAKIGEQTAEPGEFSERPLNLGPWLASHGAPAAVVGPVVSLAS